MSQAAALDSKSAALDLKAADVEECKIKLQEAQEAVKVSGGQKFWPPLLKKGPKRGR